jgi:muramoyltetrapeptide carboxypeptidase
MYPTQLYSGDTIGILSPASPQRDEKRLYAGIQYLENQGFRVRLGDNALARYAGYLAGTDAERAADIMAMFTHPDIKAIVCARGGYGTPRLLSLLDYEIIAANPKIFVGFSDTTALQCALYTYSGLVTFSGAMASVDMPDFDPWSEKVFWQALMSSEPLGNLEQPTPIQPLVEGLARGRLMGGNLSMLASLCGTAFAPHWQDCILVCEDVGEEPYRVDRLFTQLALAGVFDQIAGIAFGQFTDSAQRPTSVPQRSVQEICEEFAVMAQKPAIMNLQYGHTSKKWTLPIGAIAEIDGTNGTMKVTKEI